LDVPSVHTRKIGIEGTGRRVPPTTIAILAAQPNGRDAILFFTLYLSWRNPISAFHASIPRVGRLIGIGLLRVGAVSDDRFNRKS